MELLDYTELLNDEHVLRLILDRTFCHFALQEETSSLLEGGLFKNINIDLTKATKELPDFDARSTITSKTFKGLNMSKKEKRKQKHDAWMKRKCPFSILNASACSHLTFTYESTSWLLNF